MKLSTRARYSLRAMMVVARDTRDGAPINLAEVANRTHLPRRYLEQVAISLKNAGLLRAVAGKNGGHLLTRPAGEIRLGEIVEAAIGPINIVECLADSEACMLVEGCECRSLYSMINRSIRDAFNSFTLADLAEQRVTDMVRQMTGPEPGARAGGAKGEAGARPQRRQ